MKRGKSNKISKKNIILAGVVIVLILLAFWFYFKGVSLTGKVVLTQIACHDSDIDAASTNNNIKIGKNFNTAGRVYSKEGNAMRFDHCKGNTDKLVEYFCEGNKAKSVEVKCPNGCEEVIYPAVDNELGQVNVGRCKGALGTQCTDSDGADGFNTKTTVTNGIGKTETDRCVFEKKGRDIEILENGNKEAETSDLDASNNPKKYNIVVGQFVRTNNKLEVPIKIGSETTATNMKKGEQKIYQNEFRIKIMDILTNPKRVKIRTFSLGENKLREFFCDNRDVRKQKIDSKVVNCPYGCDDGACKQNPSSSDRYKIGTYECKYGNNAGEISKGCDSFNNYKTGILEICIVACTATDKTFENCVKSFNFKNSDRCTCIDSDDRFDNPLNIPGIAYGINRNLNDRCHNATHILEAYCDESGNAQEKPAAKCGFGCTTDLNNIAFCERTQCTDSDKRASSNDANVRLGKNFELKGMTNGLDNVRHEDSCLGSTLTEWFCKADGNADSVQQVCIYGCTEGKCNPNPGTGVCIDSDKDAGERAKFTPGHIVIESHIKNDYCINSAGDADNISGVKLIENKCIRDRYPGEEEYICSCYVEDGRAACFDPDENPEAVVPTLVLGS